MVSDFVLRLFLRDLLACVDITIVAMVIIFVIAVPVTFMAKHPGEFRALHKRFLWNWFVGVANTAGSWILLTAALDLWLQWLPDTHAIFPLPAIFAYFLCLVASIRFMWRAANTPVELPKRWTFSLRTLLLVQVILLAVCGLWVACRRGEIEDYKQQQAEQLRQLN